MNIVKHHNSCHLFHKSKVGLFLLPTLFFLQTGLYAQKIMPTPEDLFSESKEYMLSNDYTEALYLLLNLASKGYNAAGINYRIGQCYLHIQGQRYRALPYLQEAVRNISADFGGNRIAEDTAPPKALFYLGIAYRLNHHYDQAISTFGRYMEWLALEDTSGRSMTEYQMERCTNAREMEAAPDKVIWDTLPPTVNTVFSDYNPLVTANGKQLYFMEQLKFYDAVMGSTRGDSSWQKPDNLTPDIRSDGDFILTGMSADGSCLLFSAYDPVMAGELYMTRKINGTWSALQKLNSNINTRFNESHASLSPDGKILYFTSDRKGGYGGLDIYRSFIDAKGDWGPAENLGPLINTPYNEETPFISGDGRILYFSSQGHYNMGGYDVFRSVSDSLGGWTSPVNLGYPVNTPDDDLFFFPVGSGTTAYQARYTPPSPNSEIVRMQIIAYGNPARFVVKGKARYHSETPVRPDEISIDFDGEPGQQRIAHQVLQADSSFSQKVPGGNYILRFSRHDSVLFSKTLEIPFNMPQNDLLLSVVFPISTGLHRDTLYIRDIRFAFNSNRVEDKYRNYLDSLHALLLRYPDLKLDLAGYTDSRGPAGYNQKLSVSRACAVAGNLGLNAPWHGKIHTTGFGEEHPVARNRQVDGKDSEEGRSYNRRVEIEFSGVPDSLVLIRHSDIPAALRADD
jgi:outer membrane protein OmpA-like peptidoglycan-associated protein